jgi:hypothetical protein
VYKRQRLHNGAKMLLLRIRFIQASWKDYSENRCQEKKELN